MESSKAGSPRSTPLSRLIEADERPRRSTPLDVLERARTKWLAGDRIDIGKLAHELGVGRATVFRWVGTRENLYGEVCSALFARELERARGAAKGTGVAKLLDTLAGLLRSLATAAPLRRFVADDPEFALRVLTSRASPVQYRCTVAIRELLDELIAAGALEPALPSDELAYVIVRITEAFLYRDVLTGDAADVEAAIRAIGILVKAGRAPTTPRPATSRFRTR
jgi:AcrR family transcriptional regulator